MFLMMIKQTIVPTALPKRLYEELNSIICHITNKRFCEDAQSFDKNDLLLSLIGAYQISYSLPMVDCLTKALETIDDDRMAHLVPYLLKNTVSYLESVISKGTEPIQVNKLLYLVQILYK